MPLLSVMYSSNFGVNDAKKNILDCCGGKRKITKKMYLTKNIVKILDQKSNKCSINFANFDWKCFFIIECALVWRHYCLLNNEI